MESAVFQIRRPVHAVSWLSRKPLVLALLALLLSWPQLVRVNAAAGDLDPTFGIGGKVTTNFFGNRDELRSIALQADGKVVVGGVVQSSDSICTSDFGLARYNTSGSLDSSFGSNGKVTTDFLDIVGGSFCGNVFGSVDELNALAIQRDGKIIAAGNAGTTSALARYNIDGSLDSTFGSGGKVAAKSFFHILAVAIQQDGKIVGAGFAQVPGTPIIDFGLVRCNTDGSLDTSFGANGTVATDFFGGDDFANALAIQSDGKIIAGGIAQTTPIPFSFDFAIARYNTDGSIDPLFGSSGKVTTEFVSGAVDQCNALALQSDGRLVAGGSVRIDSVAGVLAEDFALARYNADGSLDPSFGLSGKVTTDFFGLFDEAKALAIHPNGKLVAFGFAGSDFALALYNNDGGLDSSFGSGGKVTTDFGTSGEFGGAVAIQPDGKIIGAGIVNGANLPSFDFALARYTVPQFDICLQDDGNGNLLQFNSTTGDYQFTRCSDRIVLNGTGSLIKKGGVFTLQHNAADRRVLARVDTGLGKGTASIQIFSQGTIFTITDRNTTNNACTCP